MIETMKTMSAEETANYLIGQTEDEVNAFLPYCSYDRRTVRKDEAHYVITCDLKLDRLNLEFDNGVVTKCYLG